MGGSGGGSSNSTTYTYPEWVRDYYVRANDATWSDAESAKLKNPYQTAPISPSEMIYSMKKVGEWVDREVYFFNPKVFFDTIISGEDNIVDSIFGILSRQEIKDIIAGEASEVMRVVDEQILPKFRRGMQTIGAVNTSAFKIGEALIWSGQLEKLNEKYYDKLAVPAFMKTLDTADKLLDMQFKKLGLLLSYAELQLKIDTAIHQAQQTDADAWNAYRSAQLMWPIEIDKFLISAAGSWQSTPSSTRSSQKNSADPVSSIFSGALGLGSLVMGGMALFSDRNMKEDIEEVDSVLCKLENIPIYKYRYKKEYAGTIVPKGERIGPMAQDWAEQFGGEDKVILFQDILGVLLASVKELNDKLNNIEKRLEESR